MNNYYTLIFSFALLGTMNIAEAQVSGDTSVCAGESVVYHIPPVAGASYNWNVSGGSSIGSNTADSVTVSWGIPGTGSLMVTLTPPSGPPQFYTLNVNIHPNPDPKITHAPYPGCPPEQGDHSGTNPDQGGKDNCEKVCKYATIVYTTTLNAGSVYSWVATGALTLSGATTNAVTVTWDGSAVGSLTVYETNAWGCRDSSSLCIKKTDLPVAAFTHPLSVCKFATVPFTNQSTGAVSYQWYFGDGGSSTQVNPTHSYANGGTYTITLIAVSECFCSDTIQSTITVSSEPGPEISCPSTLCAFDTATYSTSSSGCNYNWFAVGGSISGPSNLQSVTVVWGAGQMGHLGLFVTGCSGVCTDTTWIDIYIVPSVATISGPHKVCPGDCEEFSLPLFSGATYTWSLNSGSCGHISDSACCNKIEICWPPYVSTCVDTLKVTYFDSFLNCGGTAQFLIRVRPKLSIFGLNQGCSNGISNFYAFPGLPVNWTVSPAGPVISGTPGPSAQVDWNGMTGNFVLTVKPVNPNAVCNDSAILLVNVIAPPAAPLISGDTVTCPGNTVQYCATGAGTIRWIVTGGTPSTGTGNCINVTFGNTPPFLVSAFIQMPLSPYCSSDTTSQTIHTVISIPAASFSGNHTVCANSTTSFSSSSPYMPGTAYNWNLSPSNSGTIVSGQGSSSIQIEWGNNAPQTVVLSLTASQCGLTKTDTFHIQLTPPPNPAITQIGTLCPGVNAQLQATGGAFTAYQWSGPSGFSSAINPATIVLPGLYQVTVTDAAGCTALTQITVFNVGAPTASISALGPLQYCIGSAYSVGLCALGNPGYTYVWSNGPLTQCNYVNTPGTYVVTVTDVTTGCYSVSNVLTVAEDSCLPDTGSCIPAGSISFTHSSCNPKVFTNTSINGSSFSWYFGDLNTSNLVNPTHYYNQAGFYTVTLYGYVPNAAGTDSCLLMDTALIEIPLLAKFSFTTGCNGAPVCFTDHSVTTAGNFISAWNWNFGDANSSTLQNPCHTYATAGTYIVTLTISNPNCTTSITDTLVIAPPPLAAFGISPVNCLNSPVAYSDSSTININYWNWSFGNGGTSLNQNPYQSYTVPGFYPVTLIIHDIYGCYDTLTKNVYINVPIASGNITAFPDTVVCAGTAVTLVAPYCSGCSYTWSTGSVNDSISVTSTGIYAVVVTDSNGCSYSAFIHVIVNLPPYAVISSTKSTLCAGDFTTLSVPYSPDWLYTWISNDTSVNGNTFTAVNVNPAVPGVYTFQVAITDTVTGCSDTTLAFIVSVHLPPVSPSIAASGPSMVCKGDSITLVATHPDPAVTFQWSTGEINDTIKVTKTGCYSVSVTDTNGCTASASYCVTVNPLPEVCSYWTGCFDTCSPYVIKGPPGAASWQWLLNGVPLPGDTLQNLVANVGGAYSVIVTNSFGCSDTSGVLNLSLHPCPDSLCSAFVVDSVYCNSQTGHYIVKYHVINHSVWAISEVNLQVFAPNLNIAYAPNMAYVNLAPGDTSGILTSEIYNGTAGSSLCFRVHISSYDLEGNEIFCCNSDTVCFTLPQCPPEQCCHISYLSDSVWCVTSATGASQYHFQIVVQGCGTIEVAPLSDGNINLNNPYVDQGDITTISGTYMSTGNILCLLLMVHDSNTYCADTTICFNLPQCPPVLSPCDYLSANFTTDITGYTVHFNNTSEATNGMVIIATSWNFGDTLSGLANTSSLPYPIHIYTQPGTYTICLVVVGMYPGTTVLCAKLVCQTITITNPYQVACEALQAGFLSVATGLNVHFTDESQTGGFLMVTNWSWNFGDPNSGLNNLSTIQNPEHHYPAPGFYTVCLVITATMPGESIICYDTLCYTISIVPYSTLSGVVSYNNPALTAMSDVSVHLWSGNNIIKSTTTNSGGHYEFDSLSAGTYYLTFSLNKPWGGVNATDALLILKHFVGISYLHGLPLLVANLDNAPGINAVDALLASRRFVGLINNFAVGDWAFERPNVLINPNTNIVVNVKALCAGDVNGSYDPAGLKTGPSLGLETSGVLEAGINEEIKLPVYLKHSAEVAALSLVLRYPDTYYSISDITMLQDNQNLAWSTHQGEVRIAWFTLEPQRWNEQQAQLFITLKKRDAVQALPDNCCFELVENSSIATFTGEDIIGNALLVPAIRYSEKEFSLGQNYPNPFSASTRITYYLPANGHIRSALFDAMGKEVKLIGESDQKPGTYTVSVDGAGLDDGIYLYRMYYTTIDRKYLLTRRMVIQH